MNFLKSIFNKKEDPITTYAEFWNWFEKNEKKFYYVVKKHRSIEGDFFDKLAPKLNELKDGFWYLTGMYDDDTAELIITADGLIKDFVFVEELINAAPRLKNWKFTALKQPTDLKKLSINIHGYTFDEHKMHFYYTEHKDRPDEIDITITHEDYDEENKETIINGVFLSLDNTLGELNFALMIDNINIINPKDAELELNTLDKLKGFLIWREKEFIEKYKGIRQYTNKDNFSGFEATLSNGLPLIAIINKDLLNWEAKASHPWIAVVEIYYNGKNINGMPDKRSYQLMDEIEDEIMEELKDYEGYLNIGRQTADSTRKIFIACIEFRNSSKVLHKIQQKYSSKLELDYVIYKDKYWKSFDQFNTSQNLS